LKASEIIVGGYFYLKEDDVFRTCQITAQELKGSRGKQIRELTEKYSKEGRLFVRSTAPFKSFV
jgi:hypothetical protein